MAFRPPLWLRNLALGVLAVAAGAAQAPSATGGPATLAVLPLRGAFAVPKPASPAQSQAPPIGRAAGQKAQLALEDQIVQRVTVGFFRTGRFQLIERTQLAAVLKEGRFEHSGLVDDATAASLGKQLGAAYVLVGSYTGGIGHTTETRTGFFGGTSRTEAYPGHLEVRLRLVNTEDGSIREALLLHAASQDPAYYHSYELLLDDLSRSLDQDLAARFPLTGYVIQVITAREALVDLGRKQHLARGARFLLVEPGEDVVHPVTGKLVKGVQRVLTELRVEEVGEESSVLEVTGARTTLRVGQTVVQAP